MIGIDQLMSVTESSPTYTQQPSQLTLLMVLAQATWAACRPIFLKRGMAPVQLYTPRTLSGRSMTLVHCTCVVSIARLMT